MDDTFSLSVLEACSVSNQIVADNKEYELYITDTRLFKESEVFVAQLLKDKNILDQLTEHYPNLKALESILVGEIAYAIFISKIFCDAFSLSLDLDQYAREILVPACIEYGVSNSIITKIEAAFIPNFNPVINFKIVNRLKFTVALITYHEVLHTLQTEYNKKNIIYDF